MTTRIVAVGVMTYREPCGAETFAHLGDEVDVHPDDLARFDRLNRYVDPYEVQPEPVEAQPAAEDEPSGTSDAPDFSAMGLAELREYAAAHEIDLGEATRKADIVAILSQ